MDTPLTFLLIRHGETAWNREGRIQGQRDSALTARGIAQARAAAARVAAERPDVLYSSDLGRAGETARHVSEATDLAVRLEPGLRERRYGIFEGKTWPEIERDHPDDFARHAARDPDHLVPGGESPNQFRVRVLGTLDRIAREAAAKRIAVVAHGGVLDVLYREAMRIPLGAPRAHALLNATLNRLRWTDGAWELERWGEASHLASGAALDDSEV
ncbi:MAG TPA: histidine phosphatase family protein [Anaeromyxobacter sp.]